MKLPQLIPSLLFAPPICVLMAQPVLSQAIQVTDVRFNPTPNGLEIVLDTADGATPEALTTTSNQTFVVDIPNAQLKLAQGNEVRNANPVEGISEVTVRNVNSNSIQIRVMGTADVPQVEVVQGQGLTLGVTPAPSTPTAQEQPEEEIELVVTATRTEEEITKVPRSVTVIPRERIEQEARLNRNLGDILSKTVPGFSPPANRANTFGLTLRGRGVSVLIDGVPQNVNVQAVTTELNRIDPSAIERIEVVRGPNAIYGGRATGGVINIITKRASEKLTATTEVGTNFSATHSADSFGYNLLQSVSGTEGIFDYLASFSYARTNGFFDAEGDRITQFAGTEDTNFWNGILKLGLDIDEQQRLQFTFNYYNQDQDIDYIPDESLEEIPGIQKARSLRLPAGTRVIGEENLDSTENLVANLSYTNNDIFGSKLQTQLYYQSNKFPSGFPTDNRDFLGFISATPGESRQFGGRLQIETPFDKAETVSLLWGVDYNNEKSSQDFEIFDSDEFDNSGGRIYRKIDERTFVPETKFSDLGLFAQLQWDITDSLQISGGLRYVSLGLDVEDYTTFDGIEVKGGERDFSDTVFNAGIVYNITNEISVFANFAQGFSVPDIASALRFPPSGFVSVSDSIELTEPQKVDNYEIGIRGQWEPVQASLSAFYNYSDLGLDFEIRDDFIETIRAPQRVYGIEAALDVQPADNWRFGTTFTWLEGENDVPDDDEGYIALNSITIPPLKITAYVENETLPGWRNRLQMLFSGSRDRAFEDNVDEAEIDSYVVFDFISSIKLGSGELQIGVQNLLNNQYYPVYSQYFAPFFEANNYAAPGTTLSVSYRFTW